ncbi:MAG: hypothetical protein IPK16_26790, partial [Anaerolineales bacterium]|nr:hypothetical protein [Anaerolineales bacterium]
YLAIMGLSIYSLIGLFGGLQQQRFAANVDRRMPVRFLAFVLAVPLLLVPVWGMGIYQGIRTQQAGAADLVFVLDLTILLPAMTIAAVQIWKRSALGYQISGPLLVKAAISGLLLTAGSLMQIVKGFSVGPDVAMYLFLLVAGAAGLLFYLKHLHEPTVSSEVQPAAPLAGSQPN